MDEAEGSKMLKMMYCYTQSLVENKIKSITLFSNVTQTTCNTQTKANNMEAYTLVVVQ